MTSRRPSPTVLTPDVVELGGEPQRPLNAPQATPPGAEASTRTRPTPGQPSVDPLARVLLQGAAFLFAGAVLDALNKQSTAPASTSPRRRELTPDNDLSTKRHRTRRWRNL